MAIETEFAAALVIASLQVPSIIKMATEWRQVRTVPRLLAAKDIEIYLIKPWRRG